MLPIGIIFVSLMFLVPSEVPPGDSAELITAAYTLGVAHPTGYPLYTALGYLFSKGMFFLSPAYALNLLSAFMVCLSQYFLLKTLKLLNIGNRVAWIAMVSLFLTHCIFRYSLIAEVYTLHLALFSGVLYLMLSIEASLKDGGEVNFTRWFLCFFIAGLAFNNHATFALSFIPIFAFILPLLCHHQKLELIPSGLMAFVLGLSFTLVLFVFDRLGGLNYLDQYCVEYYGQFCAAPLDRYVWIITAAQYNAITVDMSSLSLDSMHRDIVGIFRVLFSENPVLFVIGFLGFLPLQSRAPRLFVFAVLQISLTAVFFMTYSFTESIHFVNVYFLLAIGLAFSIDHLSKVAYAKAIVLPTSCLALALSVLLGKDIYFNREDYSAHNKRSVEAFSQLAENAVIFSNWSLSPSLWYFQRVLGIRPDIEIVNASRSNWLSISSRQHFVGRKLYFQSRISPMLVRDGIFYTTADRTSPATTGSRQSKLTRG